METATRDTTPTRRGGSARIAGTKITVAANISGTLRYSTTVVQDVLSVKAGGSNPSTSTRKGTSPFLLFPGGRLARRHPVKVEDVGSNPTLGANEVKEH